MSNRIRHILVVFALLATAVVAMPSATATTGVPRLEGTITVSSSMSGVMIVDLFRTTDGLRLKTVYSAGTGDSNYVIPDIPAGTYRLRFRFFSGGGASPLTHYQWYTPTGPVSNYDDATNISFSDHETLTIDQVLDPITPGGSIDVTVTDAATSMPLDLVGTVDSPAYCRVLTVFEASGIGIGLLWPLRVAGPYPFSNLPEGDYKVIFSQRYGEGTDCTAASPEYLDQWYGGARGTSFLQPEYTGQTNASYFSTGSTVTVSGGSSEAVDIVVRRTPLCDGLVPTIIGTSLRDTITGTAGSDVIVALGGRDRIRGLGGNDRICAGSGNDTVRGGSGADRIFGQGGNDKLRGNGGADYIKGGSGNDVIRGGGGNDDLRGNRGNDTIIGGSGTDVARGGRGIDSCAAEIEIRCE